MKVVSAKEIARVERIAYSQGAKEEEFMETAAEGVCQKALQLLSQSSAKGRVILLCGAGNNAADAYVAGALLRHHNISVTAYSLASSSAWSPLCHKQSRRFRATGGLFYQLASVDDLDFSQAVLLIDGIFGTGFHGKVEGLHQQVIEKVNASSVPVLSIDIPSGVNGTTGEVGSVAIRAHTTLCLEFPKTGCFLAKAWEYVGKLAVHPFGLADYTATQAQADLIWLDKDLVVKFLPVIHRTRHKYERGYVVGLAGSHGMSGAPLLSSFTTLRAGAGIVRLFHPKNMEAELAHAPFEVIRQSYETPEEVIKEMKRASAIFIGPGLGVTSDTAHFLRTVLSSLCQLHKPCVLDADALTLIAQYDLPLPSHAILTPHMGEMKRLLKLESLPENAELLKHCQRYCEEKQIILILKGAPTFLFHPGELPHVCSCGDPGMATAGSGDVLTGILAGILAQLHNPWEAAQFGTYLHGLAGEMAAQKRNSYSIIASDITEALPSAFNQLI
ncbi:MAG: NAD(P)H-hydrate dehydratase [Verrucomicrobia bacterium]|nr:NAD(P)H-hydrate dehydratase [Verrucomicrobiota bacterium]MBS0646399.1 NAD(P)H-hydrate dehydratase [Verrucomicrobiota bacterium]